MGLGLTEPHGGLALRRPQGAGPAPFPQDIAPAQVSGLLLLRPRCPPQSRVPHACWSRAERRQASLQHLGPTWEEEPPLILLNDPPGPHYTL